MLHDSQTRRQLVAKRLHDGFTAQVQQTPGAIALISERTQLSYGDLNASANRLAHYLQKMGVGPEVRVGICIERSLEMVISIMGVLKAGGAYVPLDPAYPRERLKYMIEDAGADVLLTSRKTISSLPGKAGKIVYVDGTENEWSREDLSNPECAANAENLAYVIYTSGSTGLPKGVCITHQSICNHMDWLLEEFSFNPADKILQKTPFSFDASVWEFHAPLLCGGTLVMARPDGHREPDYLIETIIEHGITTLQLVPSQMQMLLHAEKLEECRSLRRLFCGGEALDKRLLEQVLMRLGSSPWVTNLYGPTECTIDATFWSYTAATLPEIIPIGKAIANTQIYVLGPFYEPLKAGNAGELFIGGIPLARGYLNRPELTAQKFVPDPFSGRPGARLYKTGDLAEWNNEGELEYVRRIDQQIKLRGYRIELQEIEAVLARHPLVQQAVVEPWGNGEEKRLAGYIVPAGPSLQVTELREYLLNYLPEYMAPSALVVLKQLPLTANGKLDRKALPEPKEQWTEPRMEFVEPNSDIEKQIAQIWKSILRIERVGRHDNFFNLGGNSLLGTVALAHLRDELKFTVSLGVMFENPTVAGVAAFIEKARLEGTKTDNPHRFARTDTLVLSFSQERVWFLGKLHSGNLAYNYQSVLRFEGVLSVSALEQALQEVVRRHEILRTTFHERNGQPEPVIHEAYIVKLPVIDLQESRDPESRVQALIGNEIQKPFNLEQLPLAYWTLFRLAPDHHLLLHKEHHMLHDGWSFNLLLKELFASYEAYSKGTVPSLPELTIQFADFAQWQREWIKSEEAARQLSFWKCKLADSPELLALPWDFPRPPVLSLKGMASRLDLPIDLCDALRSESRKNKVTLFMTTFTAFAILLHRLTGATDICVGSGIANRRWKETETLMGMLVNNIVLRIDLSGNPTIKTLLQRVKEITLEAYSNQDLPFDKVVEALHPRRDPSSNPLFQVMFSFHDSPLCSLEGIGPRISMTEGISNGSAKWDLNVVFIPRAEQKIGHQNAALEPITMVWEYSSDLFQSGSIDRWIGFYQNVLRVMIASPEQRISELPLMTSEQREVLLSKLNQSRRAYPRESTLQELFLEQVRLRSTCKAVSYETQTLTYEQLNIRANQLAHYLRKKGVQPETPIGISGKRSLEMVVGVLAIVKAGAVYVPMDPDAPPQRQRWLAQDMQMQMILVVDRGREAFAESGVELVCMDGQLEEISKQPTDDPGVQATPENLAYIIYTSGSTGTPKGVAIPHRGVVRLVKAANYAKLTSDDKFLQFSPLSFDPSALEIWGSLLNGSELVVMTDGKPSLEALGKAIRKNGITVLWLSSGIFHLMAEHCLADLQSVRQVLAGGDVVAAGAVKKFLHRNPSGMFVDGYGPTENSTFTCCHAMREGDLIGSAVPIGKPVSNTQVYVLDENLEPVPPGVVGELYTGGDGLARGYFNRPEVTAEKFIPNRFSETGGERLYRIGDLVRYRSDGILEFLGRKDQQTKIRGYRIELGEIESVLGQYEKVRENVVLAEVDATGQKSLVAYAVTGDSAEKAELREYLKERLPEYMVPGSIVLVPEMPLTPNGKIDRRKLLEVAAAQRADTLDEPQQGYISPRNEQEQILIDMWAEMLNVDAIGIHDNFFDLGGHSLLLMQMVSKIRELFGVEIPLRKVFECPAISNLSRLISLSSEHPDPNIRIIRPRGLTQLPASFAQRRLWFLESVTRGEALYNIPVAHRLKGKLDIVALENSINEIIRRHETLRTRFMEIEGEPLQVIKPELKIQIAREDLQAVAFHQSEDVLRMRIKEEGRRRFNLSKLPLIRVRLFQTGPEEHTLMVVMHHIISDAWSLRIFYRELDVLYQAFRSGKQSALNSLPVQYADYTMWLQEQAAEGRLEPELQYWRDQLAGAPDFVQLPTDYPRPDSLRHVGGSERFELNQDVTEQLKRLSRHNGVTLSMTLLAAYSVLLYRCSEQEDILIGTPVVNRSHEELNKLIGFFVNMVVMRVNLRGNPTFVELLKRIRKLALGAYAHQELPFERLVDDLKPERSLNRNPLFQVVLNVLNTTDTALQLAEIESAPVNVDTGTARFDLYLEAIESDRLLQLRLIHDSDLFASSTATEISRRFEQLIAEILKNENQRIGDLDLLLSGERVLLRDTSVIEEGEETFLL
jgi:amino acid adenylation domain-containing protein